MGTQYHENDMTTISFSMIFIFANLLFFLIFLMYMNSRKSRILNISGDVAQKVKIPMTIGEVPKVGILNISKDQEQKLIFSWFAEGGGGQDANRDMDPSSSPPDPQ